MAITIIHHGKILYWLSCYLHGNEWRDSPTAKCSHCKKG